MRIAEAKERLNIFSLGAMLYPEWRAGRVCRSPFREDRSPSFSVSENGALWNDFAAGEGGDAVDFLARAKGIGASEAAREFIRLAGGSSSSNNQSKPVVRSVVPARPPYHPSPMPSSVAAAWEQGVSHLKGSPELQSNLSSWRGWPVEAVCALIASSLVGCPVVHGGRAVAFKVESPIISEREFNLLPVGFHARLRPSREGERASWRFMPSEREHGRGIPSLPFVLRSPFPAANRIICTEGQWDCVSLAIASGWPNRALPDGIVLIGVRGAQGINPFLEAYSQHWPKDAEALLVPDNDSAGSTWHVPKEGKKNFAEKMAERCARVRVVKVPGQHKDINDALRGGDLSPGWALEILEG
jgi:hypothetical protein